MFHATALIVPALVLSMVIYAIIPDPPIPPIPVIPVTIRRHHALVLLANVLYFNLGILESAVLLRICWYCFRVFDAPALDYENYEMFVVGVGACCHLLGLLLLVVGASWEVIRAVDAWQEGQIKKHTAKSITK